MRAGGLGLTVAGLAVLSLVVACEPAQEGPAEEAGEKVDQTVEETKETVEDTVEQVGEKLEEAGDKVREETQQ